MGDNCVYVGSNIMVF